MTSSGWVVSRTESSRRVLGPVPGPATGPPGPGSSRPSRTAPRGVKPSAAARAANERNGADQRPHASRAGQPSQPVRDLGRVRGPDGVVAIPDPSNDVLGAEPLEGLLDPGGERRREAHAERSARRARPAASRNAARPGAGGRAPRRLATARAAWDSRRRPLAVSTTRRPRPSSGSGTRRTSPASCISATMSAIPCLVIDPARRARSESWLPAGSTWANTEANEGRRPSRSRSASASATSTSKARNAPSSIRPRSSCATPASIARSPMEVRPRSHRGARGGRARDGRRLPWSTSSKEWEDDWADYLKEIADVAGRAGKSDGVRRGGRRRPRSWGRPPSSTTTPISKGEPPHGARTRRGCGCSASTLGRGAGARARPCSTRRSPTRGSAAARG